MSINMNNKIALSIVSPSYNKGKTIRRLFDSLIRQSSHEFEWIVINDGSTDDTVAKIKSFQTDLFPIRFVDKHNEGLNRTYNLGVKMAQGDYLIRVDPDDYLTDDAVEQILKYRSMADNDDKLCGMTFLTKYSNGETVGYHPFSEVYRCNFADYRLIHHGKGDRFEVVKTSVSKKFPMLEIDGEKFCRETPMWYGMAVEYDTIYIPYPIYIREYNENSISANPVKNLSKNPIGAIMGYVTTLNYLETKRREGYHVNKETLRAGTNLYRFGLYSKNNLRKSLVNIPLRVKFLSVIPGVILHYIDRAFPNLVNRIVCFYKR